jgi:phage N-6-adenine-methyltransferase
MFSSKSNEWTTPQWLFDELNKEFEFTLDPCSTHENHKCNKYYTNEDDGLKQDWSGEVVFVNPPYGNQLRIWVKKCHEESQKPNTIVVMLIPSRTDTSYFHDYIYNKAEIRFLRGRLKFGDSKNSAPFPSMIVVFNPNKNNLTNVH